jgi:pSer/pThr/pTyr-binding forkhead associated (FHA) protein
LATGRLARGARYKLRRGEEETTIPVDGFVIGRASDCQLRLRGGLVSRQHARLTVKGDELVLEDLKSRNGVLVNHRKIHGPTALAHGDVIGVGLESLEVVDEQIAHRAENLSTLPPRAPLGEADVDAPEQVTVAARLEVLTEREREVLELIVLGHTQREMSEKLHVSVKTIETHRANIAEKVGCRTRAELVSYAISAGLLRHKGFGP